MAARTWSTLIAPVSPGSMTSTSACTPRAMRRQALQLPQASGASSPSAAPTTLVQLNNCASESAASRFPTPSGPAKMRLGGREPRAAARATRSRRTRCPARCRKGMSGGRIVSPAGLFLGLVLLFVLVFLVAAEDARPEAALLLRGRLGFRGSGLGGRARGSRGVRRRRRGGQAGRADRHGRRARILAEDAGQRIQETAIFV